MQVFNEFNARSLLNNINIFKGISKNPIFLAIVVITMGLQLLIVEFGTDAVKTAPLTAELWGWSVFFGSISWPWGLILRLVLPLKEDPRDFFGYDLPTTPQPVPPYLEGKVHQAYDKVPAGDGNHNTDA